MEVGGRTAWLPMEGHTLLTPSQETPLPCLLCLSPPIGGPIDDAFCILESEEVLWSVKLGGDVV
jgi:hypothetical protein